MRAVIQALVGLTMLSCLGWHPYSYYIKARLVICAGTLALSVHYFQTRRYIRAGLGLAVFATFQPVLKLHLSKAIWDGFDSVVGVLLLADAALASTSKDRAK